MPTTSKTERTLLLIGRIALGGVFLYAVFAKLNYPPGNFFTFKLFNWQLAIQLFAISVNTYQVLPDWAVTPVAYAVPMMEFVIGVLLLTGWGLRWVGAAGSALLGFFFTLMLRAYFMGQSIDCGCFGPGDQLGLKTLLRDGGLLLLALLITWGAFRQAKQTRGEVKDVQEANEVKEATVAG